MNYKNTYIGRLLNALSQLGNTIIGGNPDVSISARVGYNSVQNNNAYWNICRSIIYFTFKPLDGRSHCVNAYLRDMKEDYLNPKGSFIGLIFMTIIMLIFCIPLSIIFYIYELIKLTYKTRTMKNEPENEEVQEEEVTTQGVGGRPNDRGGEKPKD